MKKEKDKIPQCVIDGLARLLLPDIQEFYYGPEGSEFLSKQENGNSDSSDTER